MAEPCSRSVLGQLNETANATAAAPAVNEWLRATRAGQGLLPGSPIMWPANVSFLQALTELGVVRNGTEGYAVEIGAGDGKRLDGYHRPLDPIWPLFESGFGGLAVESNQVFDHQHVKSSSDDPPMTYASGKLSSALASANASGNVRIAWARATPTNVAELLRAHATPLRFDALNVDVDGDELPLIEAILTAGFSPATIALTINPDVPPPIQVRTRLVDPTHGGRALVGAEEPCDTWPCSTSQLARLRAAGLSGPSADAAFHSLHPAGYALLGFGFGRFSSWCLRCEHRMWWVRADVLGPDADAADAPTAYRQMVRSFWVAVYGSVEGPRGFAGKLLAHSSNWLAWRRTFDEAAAAAIAEAAWRRPLLGQTQPEQPEAGGGDARGPVAPGDARGPVAPEPPSPPSPPPKEPNETSPLVGWCLRADPCPLHAFTHAPPSRLPSLAHVLNCTLPELHRAYTPETRWLKGSFELSTSFAPLRWAMVSELLTSAAAQAGVCAFASEWMRSARLRACPPDGEGCTELETRLSVTQLLPASAPAGARAGASRRAQHAQHAQLLRSTACQSEHRPKVA